MKALVFVFSILVQDLTAQHATVPRFTDPARRSKLQAAFPEIDKIFARYREQRGIPGLVYGIVIDGEVAHSKAFGVRERKSQAPVTADTVFRIASMTKSFTVLAILKLRDEGKLSLEDPASKWIPELGAIAYPTRDASPIRIRHLLTHGAGFPEDNPWGDRQLSEKEETLTRWLKAGLPFSTSPDMEYEYSNYGFALLGRIVSAASGTRYRDYLEKQILAPLGMRASTLEPGEVRAEMRAMGYGRRGEEYFEEPSLPHGSFGAMGGLQTSAVDLGRYVAYMLSAFPPRDEEERGPVSRSSMREMQRMWRSSGLRTGRTAPDAPVRAVSTGYGYGLAVSQDCRFDHIVGHGGGLPGFGSYMSWLPNYGVGFFAMTNLTYAGPSAAIQEAFDALNGTGALKPRELPASPALLSMRREIVALWRKWDGAAAERIAANNFFLDAAPDVRRKSIEALKADLGECEPTGDVRPMNLLRGTFRMTCTHGFADVFFTLAPTMPPKLQHLSYVSSKTPEPAVKGAAERLAALIATSGSAEQVQALASKSLDTAILRRRLEALALSYGKCRVGDAVSGNGKTQVNMRFECERGPLDVRMSLDDGSKLRDVNFARPADVKCAP